MKTPRQSLPLETILAMLREVTNLEGIDDPTSSTGYRLELGLFAGGKRLQSGQ